MNAEFDVVAEVTNRLKRGMSKGSTTLDNAGLSSIQQALKDEFDELDLDTDAVRLLLEQIATVHNIDLSDCLHYLDLFDNSDADGIEADNVTDIVYHAALSHFKTCDDGSMHDKIARFGQPLTTEEVLQLCYKIHKKRSDPEDLRSQFVPLLITPSFKTSGQIVFKYATKQNVSIGDIYKSKDAGFYLQLMSQKLEQRTTRSFYKEFFAYKILTDAGAEFLVLSEKDLEPTHVVVTGQLYNVQDLLKTGASKGVKVSNQVIMAYSIHSDVRQLTGPELNQLADEVQKGGGWDYLSRKVFSPYHHPKWFERMVVAWLFSAKLGGWPLHVGIIGPAGSGKSFLINTLNNHFSEPAGVFDGSSSTLKSLCVSHGKGVPTIGLFCSSRRVCMVDELFAPLVRNNKGVSESDESHQMVNLLEHQINRASGSGYGTSVKVKPTAKMVSVSNIGKNFGLHNFMTAVDKISNPFLSRSLWYVQTDGHVAMCQAASSEFQTTDKTVYAKWLGLVELFDYFYANPFVVDRVDVERIFAKGLEFRPSGASEIYDARYRHHASCLIDGVAKLRWLCEGGEFAVTMRDVDEAEEMFVSCVASWSDVDLNNLPLRVREKYLKGNARVVYDLINAGQGCLKCDLDAAYGDDSRAQLDVLKSMGLVEEIGEEIYSHWHRKAKAERVEKELEEGTFQ